MTDCAGINWYVMLLNSLTFAFSFVHLWFYYFKMRLWKQWIYIGVLQFTFELNIRDLFSCWTHQNFDTILVSFHAHEIQPTMLKLISSPYFSVSVHFSLCHIFLDLNVFNISMYVYVWNNNRIELLTLIFVICCCYFFYSLLFARWLLIRAKK